MARQDKKAPSTVNGGNGQRTRLIVLASLDFLYIHTTTRKNYSLGIKELAAFDAWSVTFTKNGNSN
jgi:hypothetical protein